MAWTYLIGSAVFEAVWATALGQSDGFTRPVAVAVFLIALAISMGGLAVAVREIPIGTAYAVWTGIGAALTVGYALVTGAEAASGAKLIFLAGIIAAVVGLKLLGDQPKSQPDATPQCAPTADQQP